MDSNTIHDAIGLIQSGRPRDALAVLKPLATGNDPSIAAAALVNAGLAFEDIGDRKQARQCYGRSLQINSSEDGFVNLINLLLADGNLIDADTSAGIFHERHPGPRSAKMLAFVRLEQGRAAEAAGLFAQAGDVNSAVFYALHAREMGHNGAVESPGWTRPAPIPMPVADGRLRIGYLSADFREHPRHRFLLPVLKHHNHAAVEVFLYSDTKNQDAATRDFQAVADYWEDTHMRTDDELADVIRGDDLHCLIDMTGLMPGNRIGVYHRRAAPVQILYPGYPGSTGVHDFVITDERGHDGTERPLFIDGGSQCYDPGHDPLPNPEPPQVRNGYVTFGGFHRPPKITPKTIELWAGAMNATPGSMLMLVGPDNPWLRSAFDKAGVNPNRLIFKPRCNRAAYMALHDEIDVMLDAYPYQGHSTTLDAMWMGVPTVSMIGPGRQSRESTINGTYFNTQNATEFISATQLPLDFLHTVRRGIAKVRKEKPFTGARRVAAGIEDCCRQAVALQ